MATPDSLMEDDADFFDNLISDEFPDDKLEASGHLAEDFAAEDVESKENAVEDAFKNMVIDDKKESGLGDTNVGIKCQMIESGLVYNVLTAEIKSEKVQSVLGSSLVSSNLGSLETSAEGALSNSELSTDCTDKRQLLNACDNSPVRDRQSQLKSADEVDFGSDDAKMETSLAHSSQNDEQTFSEIRQVDWSSFYASPSQDMSGFGSYSDFFSGTMADQGQGEETGADFFTMLSSSQKETISTEKSTLDMNANSQWPQNEHVSSTMQANTAFYGLETFNNVNAAQDHTAEGYNQDAASVDQFYGTSQKHASSKDPQATFSDVYFYDNAYWRWDSTTEQWIQLEGYVPGISSASEPGVDRNFLQNTNSMDSQSTLCYSAWQAPESQSYKKDSTDQFVHQVEAVNEDVPDLSQSINASVDISSGNAEQTLFGFDPSSPNVAGSATHQRQTMLPSNDSTQNCTEQASWSQFSHDNNHFPDYLQNQQNIYIDPSYPGWYYNIAEEKWYEIKESVGANDYSVKSTTVSSETQANYSAGTESAVDGIYAQTNTIFDNQNEYHIPKSEVAASAIFTQENDYVQHDQGASVDNLGNKNINNLYYGNQTNTYNVTPAAQDQKKQPSTHTFSTPLEASDFQSSPYIQTVPLVDQIQQQSYTNYNYPGNSNIPGFYQPNYQLGHAMSNAFPVINAYKEGRSSAGRPPHALVTFGFGGRLAVFNPEFMGNEGQNEGIVRFYRIGQLVADNVVSGYEGGDNYFNSIRRQAFSGPLAGGNVASKEIFKWMDEKIANCQTEFQISPNPGLMHLLLSSLKIFCQNYGKLRSSFTVGSHSQESDGPEAALSNLFSSHNSVYDAGSPCLQTVPPEAQFQMIALEMKNLLVSGKRMEALAHAQQGQLWGPALVLAWQLGEKFYLETVTQMAQRQFSPGCPLRTLYLLLAGQPAEVFSMNNSTYTPNTGFGMHTAAQDSMNGMLNRWQENLAIITANRTKGDERVIIHLGDCLWKERGQVAAAHTCYLLAEANFEYFSDSSRLCLLGADHWKFPRTYASPEAIQRTEIYEYGKVLGNPQYILLPFQPYKLIYASMLAEVGKVSESLKYCQAVSKILKNAGRAPEVEVLRQLAYSMEERLRIHSQGGFGSNLAPGKLVNRIFSSLDRSIHKIIGGPPPPVSDGSSSVPNNMMDPYSNRGANIDPYSNGGAMENISQRSFGTTLMPSMSMEPLSELGSNNTKVNLQTRSVSAPDITNKPDEKKPNLTNSKAESSANKGKVNSGTSSSQSRFGRFGSQLLLKAVGFISKSHHHEAKLGEENKFRYDEKLKRWVEEGAALPGEEETLSAPPTNFSFISNTQTPQSNNNVESSPNGSQDKGGVENRSPIVNRASGTPPVPPSMNQFSARGRLQGVRSRYVDTFNKGGGNTPSKSFQTSLIPTAISGSLPTSGNFFVPAPVPTDTYVNESPNTEINGSEFLSASSTTSAPNMSQVQNLEFVGSEAPKFEGSLHHRYSSADNISQFLSKGPNRLENRDAPLSNYSRAASWSGEHPKSLTSHEEVAGLKHSENNLLASSTGFSSLYFHSSEMSLPTPPSIEPHSNITLAQSQSSGDRGDALGSGGQVDNFGDLQEVEL